MIKPKQSFRCDGPALLDAMGDAVGVTRRARLRDAAAAESGGMGGGGAGPAQARGGLVGNSRGQFSCSPMDVFVYYNTQKAGGVVL